MANKKITELPAASSVTVDDLIPIVDGGTTTQKATGQQVVNMVSSSLAAAGFVAGSGSLNKLAIWTSGTNQLTNDVDISYISDWGGTPAIDLGPGSLLFSGSTGGIQAWGGFIGNSAESLNNRICLDK